MSMRMLIDARHSEEIRVAVVKGNRIEEFDFESAEHRPLKGNIYLAKVTRVEPSLQAAFVEYGGNRQGFLAFSEIHPDYYQIPVADRMALLAAQAERAMADEEDGFDSIDSDSPPAKRSRNEVSEQGSTEGADADMQSRADEDDEEAEEEEQAESGNNPPLSSDDGNDSERAEQADATAETESQSAAEG